MKKINEMYVIGIDHGYGNMKTANCCFPTGVMKSDSPFPASCVFSDYAMHYLIYRYAHFIAYYL